MTTELVDDPRAVKTKLGYWTSKDRIHWTRVSTLFESSGEQTGHDPRAALWAPMPAYNDETGRWDVFYVGYRSKPDTPSQWLTNYDGRIYRAVSRVKGREGIGGPYEEVGVVLEPGPESDLWEGLQGTDSFYPYRTKNGWHGFYGSATTDMRPSTSWKVGLASAPKLAGPWTRCTELNPVQLEDRFSENPVVTKLADGTYLAVYDSNPAPDEIGYSFSGDGIHWEHGRRLKVQPKGAGFWATNVRTPLSFIAEDDGTYTVFYAGYMKPAVRAVGFATVRVE